MNKDTVYRQAAIDALDEQIEQCDKSLSSFDISMKDEFAVKVERASLVALRETLEYLPSAEPTFDARDTQYNLPIDTDLISRAQAINKIWDDTNYDIYTREVKEILEQLPSALPEIIRCMECKYYEASIVGNPWGVCCHKDWIANSIGHNVDEAGWCYRAERREAKQEEMPMHEAFEEGEYIIYQNGDRFELGKIKRITPDGAFVYYSSGTTAAKTPFSCMHKLDNEYVIGETSLGGVML